MTIDGHFRCNRVKLASLSSASARGAFRCRLRHESIEPVNNGVGSPETSTLEVVPNKLPAGASSTAKVRAYPRTEAGRLLGSHPSINITVDGATLDNVSYRGIGLYRGDLSPPELPGIATVTLWDEDVVLATTSIEIFDPSPPPDSTPTSDISTPDAANEEVTSDDASIAEDSDSEFADTIEEQDAGSDDVEPPQDSEVVAEDTVSGIDTNIASDTSDTTVQPEDTQWVSDSTLAQDTIMGTTDTATDTTVELHRYRPPGSG